MKLRNLFSFVILLSSILYPAISFKEPSLLPIVFDPGRNPRGIASDDFNGDGKFDIAVTGDEYNSSVSNKGYLYVFLGDGDFGFQAPISYKLPTTPATGYGYGIVTGDFDKDGKIDIFVASSELKQVLFFKGLGDGTFKDAVGTSLSYRPEGLQKFDLNGDGNLDLITCNNQDNNITILLGSGDGTFYQITNHSTNSGLLIQQLGI